MEESKSNDNYSTANLYKKVIYTEEDFAFNYKIIYRQYGEISLSTEKHIESIINLAEKDREILNKNFFYSLGNIWNWKSEASGKNTDGILTEAIRILGCSKDQYKEFISSPTDHQI